MLNVGVICDDIRPYMEFFGDLILEQGVSLTLIKTRSDYDLCLGHCQVLLWDGQEALIRDWFPQQRLHCSTIAMKISLDCSCSEVIHKRLPRTFIGRALLKCALSKKKKTLL